MQDTILISYVSLILIKLVGITHYHLFNAHTRTHKIEAKPLKHEFYP